MSRQPPIRLVHRHAWLWEPLATEPTFLLRPMFGAKAVYLDGKLMLAFCARDEPWCGVLVCTERVHHAALRAQWPELVPHPVLPKWLYLSETCSAFERIAGQLAAGARQRDPRLGIVPRPRPARAGAGRRRSLDRNSRP